MSEAYACAIRLLARREHGAYQLIQKLIQKGFNPEEANEVVNECKRQGYQSDERFVECFVRHRMQQGYGPVRIRQELQNLKIQGELIEAYLSDESEHWLEYARAVKEKKYKHNDCSDLSFAAIQKQKQFLRYRGFCLEHINQLFADV